MLKNKAIRNKTETIGFLLIITKIPEKIEAKEIKSKNSCLYPLLKVSLKRINRFMYLNK